MVPRTWLCVFIETVISEGITGPLYPLAETRMNPILSVNGRNQRGFVVFVSRFIGLCRFARGMMRRGALKCDSGCRDRLKV